MSFFTFFPFVNYLLSPQTVMPSVAMALLKLGMKFAGCDEDRFLQHVIR